MKNKPYVKHFGDYHDIEAYPKPRGWMCKEIAFGPVTDGLYCLYWGLFWKRGEKPTKSQILTMLKKAGLDFHPTQCHYHTGEPLWTEVRL